MSRSWSSGLGSLFLAGELAIAVFLGRFSSQIPSAVGTVSATEAQSQEPALVAQFKPARGRVLKGVPRASLDGKEAAAPTAILALPYAHFVEYRGEPADLKDPADPETGFCPPARAPPTRTLSR